MNIIYDNIEPGDVVITTSLSFFSCGIRIKEAGLWNIFNTKIGTHVGLVISIGPPGTRMLAIAEMLLDGLHISSFSDYLNNGFGGNRIIDIKRYDQFKDEKVKMIINEQVLQWWKQGKKYDFKGILNYVFPFLQESENAFYCSEMINWLAINITNKNIVDNANSDNITPYDIQLSKNLTSISNWYK